MLLATRRTSKTRRLPACEIPRQRKNNPLPAIRSRFSIRVPKLEGWGQYRASEQYQMLGTSNPPIHRKRPEFPSSDEGCDGLKIGSWLMPVL
jgi:hypothetical protein